MENVTVVILAAGLGTRMKSRRAKVLHQAGGQTLIEHAVDAALGVTAADRIYVVIGHQADQVRQAVQHRGVHFVEQKEQKGTGHALLSCAPELQDRAGLLVIFYGDCPLIRSSTLATLLEAQRTAPANAGGTLVTTELEEPTGYGRIVRDEAGNVRAIVEQKAATAEQHAIREINAGIYVFRSDLFWRYVHDIRPDNPAREYYLTDIIGILIDAGYTIGARLHGDAGELLGINNRVELAAVDAIFRERKARELMLAGVTIEKPETVTIDSGVRIGEDTIVEPFTRLLGKTAIGANCRIGAGSVISDSEIADGVQVGPYTVIGASRIEAGAQVGPFSRLRLDSHVGQGAHVGNFVELKKTRLGPGAKANHLAYLGDAAIGAKTNIGAGTITCNYDGVHKHGTTIGEAAFIGSNATLVAPLQIGDGAYVGAASVITESVPSNALALGRARQVTKAEWAKQRREKK